MKRAVLSLCCAVLCGFVLLGLAEGASRPVLSEVFSAATSVQIIGRDNATILHGEGVLIVNQPHGKLLERFNITDRSQHSENVYRLERFDLKKSFEIVNRNGVNSSCFTRTEEEPLRPFWEWIKEAQHSTIRISGISYDYWSFTRGFGTVGVAVTTSDPNTPVYTFLHGPARSTRVKFESWNTSPPKEAHFDVPPTCKQAGPHNEPSLGCVSRSTMISRAQVWVDNRVPYNQGATYAGYREDCSGYVSMAWEAAKPGYTTSTMHEIAHPISKNDLAPGDVLLCASEHVVLFGGWTSGAHSQFVAFEETRPGEGTVKRVTPYPYWYNTACFKPYRYNSVC